MSSISQPSPMEPRRPQRDTRPVIPRNPFEMQATKELVNKRIESGEISQSDLDILKSSYKMIALGSTLGSATLFVGTWFWLRRRRPPINLGYQVIGTLTMGSIGSFLGFTLGGVAAAMEVNTRMEDAPRKLKVFSEIATASKDQIIQSRTGQATASSSSDGNSDSGPAIWQVDSSSERQGELDRERDLSATYGRIESDSQMGSDIDRPTTPGRSGVEQGKKELDVEGTIGKQTQSTWERLRSRSLGRNEPTVQAAAGRVEDERSKEQREFDEMLEKERRGVDSDTFK